MYHNVCVHNVVFTRLCPLLIFHYSVFTILYVILPKGQRSLCFQNKSRSFPSGSSGPASVCPKCKCMCRCSTNPRSFETSPAFRLISKNNSGASRLASLALPLSVTSADARVSFQNIRKHPAVRCRRFLHAEFLNIAEVRFS